VFGLDTLQLTADVRLLSDGKGQGTVKLLTVNFTAELFTLWLVHLIVCLSRTKINYQKDNANYLCLSQAMILSTLQSKTTNINRSYMYCVILSWTRYSNVHFKHDHNVNSDDDIKQWITDASTNKKD